MKENIEKAIEILKHIKEYMHENIYNGTHKFIYNEQGFDEKCIDVINAINEILSDYKRVLKENEELKEAVEIYKEQVETKIDAYIDSNYLSKQKIKDKIEELRNGKDFDEDVYWEERAIDVLQELLEEKGE